MAETLSQSEIDALLSALSSGDLEPSDIEKDEENVKIKDYDFKRPQKFSKDVIRAIEVIHDNYARIVSNYLTAQLRSNVKVKIENVEQITYEEFIHSIPSTTVLNLFRMPPLDGQIILETNEEFVLRIYDVLAGGSGDKKPKFKELTDIEKNIIKHVNQEMISKLKLAWEDVMQVETILDSIETNPALNQILAPNEPVALITFSVDMFDTSLLINICIPHLSIEKVLDKLVIKNWFSTVDNEQGEEVKDKINKVIKNVDVGMKAVLGETKISVNDFLNLFTGDIITLDRSYDSTVDIYVEDELLFKAKPGLKGKNKAVQIIEYIDRGVENDG
ncbi:MULTISPECIES: flagellar motor switch protein FliM [Clostridium]|uniref:Flagellar motor switch protein FliM n=1 Tax=Clostridium sulfidigenes TaxID=318464 RepID=A0A084JIK6_9CLOT|nr:flagellar motor switch protein FliM [Clostridium sulfidigenes]KEZ88790.1 flagellar motor switch protein FliM [Clostridium sulfidigenes]HAR84212.1 flagellar motor switch protein FliM [Clostridium sp.]HCO74164.1 flagellar motor switch protein FliM [Clostridium sp.]